VKKIVITAIVSPLVLAAVLYFFGGIIGGTMAIAGDKIAYWSGTRVLATEDDARAVFAEVFRREYNGQLRQKLIAMGFDPKSLDPEPKYVPADLQVKR
jgi:hypothetical protein